MQVGAFQRLIGIFQQAFESLQASISSNELESLAIMIHKVMTVQTRNYHTLDHVFNLSNPADPLQSLAALFHDLVYYQVDRGLAPEIYPIVSPCIHEKEGEIRIVEGIAPDDRPFLLTLEAFGVEPGQKLSSFAGLNEFLSALVANKKLQGIVPEKDLLKVTTCIEATIPFRGKNERGETHFEVLAAKVASINERYHLSMAAAEIEEAIKRAVIFANKDVANFDQDAGMFLDSTWRLLPETNIALRSGKIYSIREYRQALLKMEAFLGSLDPDNVFHNYEGVPSQSEFQRMTKLAYANISIAREYLGIKLLPIAIYEALAYVTGGDEVPLALFMGDVSKEGEAMMRLENFLPAVEMHSSVDQSSILLKLLDSGRAGESNFDMKNSPTSLFLYKSLGPDGVKALLDNAKAMFDGKLPAGEFLARVDKPVLSTIARASAAMVPTRREKLLQYALEWVQKSS